MLLFCGTCYEAAATVVPSPNDRPATVDAGRFPEVDWEYWQGVNPAVIGWITIPETPVNYPIVQAPREDPTFYLTHDVYGNWNFAGCPYLDAECTESGLLGSENAVVFGHNLGLHDTSQFATLSRYVDAAFAEQHATALLQTPDAKCTLRIQGAACIPGWSATKRVDFADEEDFQTWIDQRLEECDYLVAEHGKPTRVVTLCTCSYNFWDDERTIIDAAPLANDR